MSTPDHLERAEQLLRELRQSLERSQLLELHRRRAMFQQLAGDIPALLQAAGLTPEDLPAAAGPFVHHLDLQPPRHVNCSCTLPGELMPGEPLPAGRVLVRFLDAGGELVATVELDEAELPTPTPPLGVIVELSGGGLSGKPRQFKIEHQAGRVRWAWELATTYDWRKP